MCIQLSYPSMISDDIISGLSGGCRVLEQVKNNLMKIIRMRYARNNNLKSKLKFYTHTHLNMP